MKWYTDRCPLRTYSVHVNNVSAIVMWFMLTYEVFGFFTRFGLR